MTIWAKICRCLTRHHKGRMDFWLSEWRREVEGQTFTDEVE